MKMRILIQFRYYTKVWLIASPKTKRALKWRLRKNAKKVLLSNHKLCNQSSSLLNLLIKQMTWMTWLSKRGRLGRLFLSIHSFKIKPFRKNGLQSKKSKAYFSPICLWYHRAFNQVERISFWLKRKSISSISRWVSILKWRNH